MNIPFDAYEIVIGFECHVQLLTKTKLFSKGDNRYGSAPNSLVDVVDAGLPGVLPVINRMAVEHALKLGLALNCHINRESVFSRKHYFYPDLPKGYQISQFDKPICENGILHFMVDGQEKSIRIRRIHIEEDAGKNIHVEGANASYVDFNRAGTPLLEVVTEPDLRSAKDAMEAFRALRQLVTFLEICDGNMAEGSIRADVNVSVRRSGDKALGTRTETKNLNSFKFLGQAVAFEARRQIIEIESGRAIEQETRLWDPGDKESRPLRSKEEAHDYRYFPDPDLLPLRISEELIEGIGRNLPERPQVKFERYRRSLGLSAYDAGILTSERGLARYFESAVEAHGNAKGIANWVINEVMRSGKGTGDAEEGIVDFRPAVPAHSLSALVRMIDEGIISSSIAKRVFAIMEKHPERNPESIVDELGLRVVADEEQIIKLVEQVLMDNPDEVARYMSGKVNVFGFLMGQLMKLGKGKLDPKIADKAMRDGLASRRSA